MDKKLFFELSVKMFWSRLLSTQTGCFNLCMPNARLLRLKHSTYFDGIHVERMDLR